MSQTTTHIDSFLKDLALQEVSPKTLASYSYDLSLFARWFCQTVEDEFSPSSITPTDIREYKSYLLNVEHRKPATINRRLAALRKFFLWAKASQLISELPTDSVKGVAQSPRAPHSLEKREVDKLIRTVERHGNKRDLAIVIALRHTGLRVSELCDLTLSDIQISDRKGSLIVRSGKGSKYRVLPLNLDVRNASASYLEVRPKAATTFVFIGQRGNGLTPQGVEILVGKYARLAGLEAVTPHTLRHSFAKHTLDQGANLVAVAALLGHQRLETTAIYTTPTQKDLEQAVDRLAAEEVARR
jgi:site-specific recombinase XerD